MVGCGSSYLTPPLSAPGSCDCWWNCVGWRPSHLIGCCSRTDWALKPITAKGLRKGGGAKSHFSVCERDVYLQQGGGGDGRVSGSIMLKTDGCGPGIRPPPPYDITPTPPPGGSTQPIINSSLFICRRPVNQKPQKVLITAEKISEGVGVAVSVGQGGPISAAILRTAAAPPLHPASAA